MSASIRRATVDLPPWIGAIFKQKPFPVPISTLAAKQGLATPRGAIRGHNAARLMFRLVRIDIGARCNLNGGDGKHYGFSHGAFLWMARRFQRALL